VLAAVTLAVATVSNGAPPARPTNVSFATQIVPIFTARGCLACQSEPAGGLPHEVRDGGQELGVGGDGEAGDLLLGSARPVHAHRPSLSAIRAARARTWRSSVPQQPPTIRNPKSS